MIDILQKADREQSRIPGEAGFGRLQVEGKQPLSERETVGYPASLTREQLEEQVAKIEDGKAPTVPSKMLEQAVAEAKKSDTLVSRQTAERLEELLNDPKSFEKFLAEHGPKDATDAVMNIAGNRE